VSCKTIEFTVVDAQGGRRRLCGQKHKSFLFVCQWGRGTRVWRNSRILGGLLIFVRERLDGCVLTQRRHSLPGFLMLLQVNRRLLTFYGRAELTTAPRLPDTPFERAAGSARQSAATRSV
jgi:hypothetical protein